jgi:REP element-mobilizing transposase RayT
MKKHRNSQKRIVFEDAIYFITSKTYNNYPYFREQIFCDLFVENLKLCKRLKGFLLYGWVLNFDHFHLLVQPDDDFNISKIMQFLKRNFSRDINYIMDFNKYDRHSEGGNHDSRLQGGLFEYFQPIIDKYDQQLNLLKSEFQQKYPNGHSFPKFQWQDSYYDHYIRNYNEFNDFLDYIDYNPEKHGLPDDWIYIYSNPKYDDLSDESC